jgi:hypothetical protein
MVGRWSLADSCLLCAYRSRLPVLKVLVAASIITYGCIFMYFKGEDDYNMFYVTGQCLWKSYGNLEQYSKSGREFPCLTNILMQASEEHGGFFDASFPTDKVKWFGSWLECGAVVSAPWFQIFALASSLFIFILGHTSQLYSLVNAR